MSVKKTHFYFLALKICSALCLLICMVWIKSVSCSCKMKWQHLTKILNDPEDSWLKIIISEIMLISVLNSHRTVYSLLKEWFYFQVLWKPMREWKLIFTHPQTELWVEVGGYLEAPSVLLPDKSSPVPMDWETRWLTEPVWAHCGIKIIPRLCSLQPVRYTDYSTTQPNCHQCDGEKK